MEESGNYRKLKGPVAKIITGLACLFCLYEIAYITGLFTIYLAPYKIYIHKTPHAALTLAFLLPLIFLLIPPSERARRDKLPWYDVLLAFISIPGPVFMFIYYRQIALMTVELTPLRIILAVLTLLAVLEAVRRTTGLVLIFIVLAFVIHPLVCGYLPGIFGGKGYSFSRLIAQLFLFPDGIFGMILGIFATIIVIYLIFAVFLQVAGAGDFLVKIALGLAGNVRGGPAKVAVLASSFLGMLSGSAVANVATTGAITIPLMKRTGQRPEFAAGVEAAASSAGQLMPPMMGATAFLIAEFLDISYGKVIIAAFFPAVLYFMAIFVGIDIEARAMRLKGLPREELPRLGKTLKEGWEFILPLAVLIICLIFLHFTAGRACLYALGTLFAVGMFRKERRWTPRKLITGLERAAVGTLQVGAICAVVGMLLGSLSLTGMGLKFTYELTAIAKDNLLFLLILTGIVSMILGTGLPTTACYILLAVTVLPPLVHAGIEPIAAHLFIFYFGLAHFITPPICTTVYIAASIAGASMWASAWQAMRLGFGKFLVPFFFVFHPGLLFQGSLLELAGNFLLASIAIVAISCGLGGYVLVRTNVWEKVLLIGGSLCIFLPIPLPFIYLYIGAFVAFAIVIVWQLKSSKRLILQRN